MCQWHHWLSENLKPSQNIRSRFIFPSEVNVETQCLRPLGEIPCRRMWEFGLTQGHYMAGSAAKSKSAPCDFCVSTCPYSNRAPHRFRAERDACVWASALPFPPFKTKTERGQESTDNTLLHPPRNNVHLFKHPSCENGRVRTRQSGNKAGFVS